MWRGPFTSYGSFLDLLSEYLNSLDRLNDAEITQRVQDFKACTGHHDTAKKALKKLIDIEFGSAKGENLQFDLGVVLLGKLQNVQAFVDW